MLRCATLLLFATLLPAQDRSDWQTISHLRPGEPVNLSLKGQHSVTGPFQTWTPEQVTVGSTTAKREDVTKVERFRSGVWGRGKTALIGALIGGGAGAAIGAGVGGCDHNSLGPCVTRAEGTGIVGGVGAIVGVIVGAVLPHHRMDLIYIAK
jgi:hypothetical protein